MTKPIRWSILRASKEWGTNVKTIALGLRQNDIQPGDDGKFSTQQINRAINGDYEAAKTRDTNASADIREINKANLLRQNIPAYGVERVVGSMLSDLRQQIMYLEIPDSKKQEICRNLQSVPLDDYFTEANTEEKDDGETDP